MGFKITGDAVVVDVLHPKTCPKCQKIFVGKEEVCPSCKKDYVSPAEVKK